MNLLKNLMILAVLAVVGYGVYVPWSRNNADMGPSSDAPKVDLSNAKPSLTPGGPLALGGSSNRDSCTSSLGAAPLTAPPLAGGSLGNSPMGTTSTTPAAPYPASGSSAISPLAPPPGLSSNNPTATRLQAILQYHKADLMRREAALVRQQANENRVQFERMLADCRGIDDDIKAARNLLAGGKAGGMAALPAAELPVIPHPAATEAPAALARSS